MKNNLLKTLFYLLLFPTIASAQSNAVSLEYFPNFSTASKIEDLKTEPKFSQSFAAKYHLFIANKSSFTVGLEISNIGFKTTSPGTVDSTSAGGFTLYLAGRTAIFDYNLFNVNAGYSINFDKYLFASEIGVGFLLSTTRKIIDDSTNGSRTEVDKRKGFKQFTVPLSIMIARKFNTYGTNSMLGLKSYYALSRNQSGDINTIKFGGVGIVLGFIID